MSTSGSPRKHPPASPSRGHKRKASESADTAGPSRFKSTSPFQPDYASSSTTSSPIKRASISSASRRNSRQTRTFQIADIDQDIDAPYDEELDADGEDDDEYLDRDAEGEDDAALDLIDTVDDQVEQIPPRATTSKTPARQTARPKRSNAPNVSYYAVPPLPGFSDEEQDEDETPSIRRRARKSKLPPTSDIEIDLDDNQDDLAPPPPTSSKSTRTSTPLASKHPSGKVPRRTSDLDSGESKQRTSAKPEDPELSEEAKQLAKAEREAEDLRSRWTEEYFEIVEQLPLEVHRTFALMRELEGQMQARVGAMVQNMTTYRDARLEMHKLMNAPSVTSKGVDDTRRSSTGGSEDEAENLLGGSQDGSLTGQQQRSQDDDIEMLSVNSDDADDILDKDARRQLLRSISLAANESVKAAEEKMGLAATAYNGIDRHIRRLDADISKLESSILLGLRTGTEESRGAREALGLPVDDGAENEFAQGHGEDGQGAATEGVSAEAESAALTKAAGAANRAPAAGEAPTGGRRSARTTPKMGGQAQLAASPKTSERARTRSRSGSASAVPAAAGALSTAAARKASSPAPAGTRTTRKRKPKPLSPQKGGRRSIVTSTPTLISPTTQTPRTGTTTVGPDVSEMPFDPTEPTYCYCDQISFDEMVACDNDDCPYEWFHYACVGLSRQPKNEWYCRFCAPPGWKGEGMGVPANAKHKPSGFKKGIGIKP
ncbi:uncharacterized protein UTRI_04023_B [Ustilago trichophora]|uniref:Chromatin modification-related protein n=1 Tax=Ustilago trichophora TaxID=86804 RepID=A0A5C3EB04_9BASI|nr:uncharacterized protein UTRI_04023_B [Ustilago trichophora]